MPIRVAQIGTGNVGAHALRSLITNPAFELTAVWVPDGAQEALRDLTRAREDMKHLQRQAKQRLLAFLLRHGRRYDGKSHWTQAHYRWLEQTKFDQPIQQIVFQEYIDAVKAMSRRVEALDK